MVDELLLVAVIAAPLNSFRSVVVDRRGSLSDTIQDSQAITQQRKP